MVDFVISAQFGLIYSKKLLAANPIFSHRFDYRAFKLYHKLLYGHLIIDCAFDDYRTIVVAMVDFAFSAQFGFAFSPIILIIELANFIKSFYMVTSLLIVLLMTIEPLWSPWWTSPFPPNLVLYIVKNS